MSRQLIHQYRSELDRLRSASGSRRESVVREAFKDLLKAWGKARGLIFIAEQEYITKAKQRRYLDGALVFSIRSPFGYWEAKDTDDDLPTEIAKKTAAGYPRTNILYEDTRTAILIQDGEQSAPVAMDDTDALFALMERFFAYERPEAAEFAHAVEQFKTDLPAVLDGLRAIIADKRASTPAFVAQEAEFLAHVQRTINPTLTGADVQEMLIQHILTEDIFRKVFDSPSYHRDNNVAKALLKLEDALFGYGEKRQLLAALRPYYAGIERTAGGIESHSEKQGFLKSLYENFYKVYNPKAADRLGVVYTPGEIVRFMIRSTDWLCERHFGRNLVDRGVEILDPATGTGTYIVELLEHFRGAGPEKLRRKYKQELHANEVAILPYYVANLNIEATYQAITGQSAEFEGLCLVDTLDNVEALGLHSGHQPDLLSALSDENIERVKRQNARKISVIIGNPPYNANQQNENDNNKNREYKHIDKRIKATYVAASTAQKTKLYDMYSRFYRWASDRLGDEGIVAFVTNNSFLHARTFDGFQKRVAEDFTEAWVVDLKGNARNSGEKRRQEGGNVFEDKIKVGIAIAFFVRTKEKKPFTLRYLAVEDYAKEDDKRSFVSARDLSRDEFTIIKPKPGRQWLDQTEDGDWSIFLPLADKKTKAASAKRDERAIFKVYSLGVVTARDDWVYARSDEELNERLPWFVKQYETERRRLAALPKNHRRDAIEEDRIKLTRAVKNGLAANTPLTFDASRNRSSLYRPFTERRLHFHPQLNEMQYRLNDVFSGDEPNLSILLSGHPNKKPFQTLGTASPHSYHTLEDTESLPRYRYTKSGERVDNVTDWAVRQFEARYGAGASAPERGGGPAQPVEGLAPKPETGADGGQSAEPLHHPADGPPPRSGEDLQITKDAIFAYCYAALHDPVYRDTYALNLKREFPRVPLHDDFARWVDWGRRLLTLHIDYEDAAPHPLTRVDSPNPKRAEGSHPKPKLKSLPEQGRVVVDEDTVLDGIPAAAWRYRLGNRSAIDWVLDQHKEKRIRDDTVRERFDTYRFADHKQAMIDLLAKVVTVSLETVAITDAIRAVRATES